MIVATTWNPAIAAAQARTLDERTECARDGMLAIIDEFFTTSAVCWANRRADGLGAIDTTGRSVRTGWQAGPGLARNTQVTALLNACREWLDGRRVFGSRVTGWREASIETLYWKVAWCYRCDAYRRDAHARVVANNALNAATPVQSPVVPPAGSPYSTADYTHAVLQGFVLRGDTRGPWSIIESAGFQPRNLLTLDAYAPWFTGHATGDTISTTLLQALAMNAGTVQVGASPAGDLAPWFTALVAALPAGPAGVVRTVRGFVYEMDAGQSASTRMTNVLFGTEHVFLSLPAALIQRWWAIFMDGHSYGPFVVVANVPAVGPVVPKVSAARAVLAGPAGRSALW